METNTNSSPSTRPGFICRWGTALFTWRTARRLLIVVAMLATLIAIFYAEENWRGKRAWEQCKRDLAAKGELLNWVDCIPAPIPDDENIIKAPKMAEWFIKPKPIGNWSNELSAKLNVGSLAGFAEKFHPQVVATVTVLPTNGPDVSVSADLVLRHRRCMVSVVHTNGPAAVASGTDSNMVPRIEISDFHLSGAIRALARQANLNYRIEPEVLARWHPPNAPAREPNVTARWENLTAREALFTLLNQYNLRCIEAADAGLARITLLAPDAPRIYLGTGTREPVQELLRQALLQDAGGLPLRSAKGSQGMLFATKAPQVTSPARVVVLSDGGLRKQDIGEIFAPGLSEIVLSPGSEWRVEPAGSNVFQVFPGRDPVYAAADYLAWSDRFAPESDLIREALKRPHIRMDDDYQRPFEIPVVNFVNIRNVAQTAAQRAQCCLLLGRSEQAFRELSLIFELRRLLAARPKLLVAAMIDVAISGLWVETIADGFRLQAWREPELAALQKELQQIKLPQALAASFRTERVAACHTLETSTAREMADLLSFGRPDEGFWKRLTQPIYVLLKFAPRGWIYLNLVTMASLEQTAVEIFDAKDQIIQPRHAALAQHEFEKLDDHWSPNNVLAAIAAPNFIRATQTTARNQTRVDQALIVCGLERYRLAHGSYPESLDVLVPQFVEKLPHDAIGGQALKYRRTADGQFVLYSVGWNETDDGGEVGWTTGKPPTQDYTRGDWVWQ